MSLFAQLVIATIAFAVLVAVIVALAVPVTERHERRQAMRRHPAGKHRHVHGRVRS